MQRSFRELNLQGK